MKLNGKSNKRSLLKYTLTFRFCEWNGKRQKRRDKRGKPKRMQSFNQMKDLCRSKETRTEKERNEGEKSIDFVSFAIAVRYWIEDILFFALYAWIIHDAFISSSLPVKREIGFWFAKHTNFREPRTSNTMVFQIFPWKTYVYSSIILVYSCIISAFFIIVSAYIFFRSICSSFFIWSSHKQEWILVFFHLTDDTKLLSKKNCLIGCDTTRYILLSLFSILLFSLVFICINLLLNQIFSANLV